jgi:hypothetical protein
MSKHNDRRVYVTKFALPELGEKMFRKIEVYYDEGGISMWTYKRKARGFYITSRVVEIDRGFETWTPGQHGDGFLLIEEAKRFNKKRLDEIAENVRKYAEQINTMLSKPVDGYIDYIQHVGRMGYKVVPV